MNAVAATRMSVWPLRHGTPSVVRYVVWLAVLWQNRRVWLSVCEEFAEGGQVHNGF